MCLRRINTPEIFGYCCGGLKWMQATNQWIVNRWEFCVIYIINAMFNDICYPVRPLNFWHLFDIYWMCNFWLSLINFLIHSASMKTERLYFLFLSKNEVSHLCSDSAIFCPEHVSMIHNWKDLQIYTQFLLLQRLDH